MSGVKGQRPGVGVSWHASIDSKQIKKIREEVGLGPVEFKTRECLKCDKQFESEGPQHRLCYNCRHYQSDYAEPMGELLRMDR